MDGLGKLVEGINSVDAALDSNRANEIIYLNINNKSTRLSSLIQKAKKKKSILSLLKELDKLRHHDLYDLVIDMQGLMKSAIISKLLPSKQIIVLINFQLERN